MSYPSDIVYSPLGSLYDGKFPSLYRIGGVVKVDGTGAKRRVLVINRDTGHYRASTTSFSNGTWRVDGLPNYGSETLMAIANDTDPPGNDLAGHDFLTQVRITSTTTTTTTSSTTTTTTYGGTLYGYVSFPPMIEKDEKRISSPWWDVLEGDGTKSAWASASSQYSALFTPAEGFDGTGAGEGDSTNCWISTAANGPDEDDSCWWQIDCQEKKILTAVRLCRRNDADSENFPKNFKVYGSLTGSFSGEEVQLLKTTTDDISFDSWDVWRYFDYTGLYRYYRITIQDMWKSGTSYDWVAIKEVEFYEDTHHPLSDFRFNENDLRTDYCDTANWGKVLHYTYPTVSQWSCARTVGYKSSKKWYFEVPYYGVFTNYITVGWMDAGHSLSTMIGQDSGDVGVGYSTYGRIYHDGTYLSFPMGIPTGYFMIAVNLDNGKFWFGKDDTWHNSGDPANDSNEAYLEVEAIGINMYPAVGVYTIGHAMGIKTKASEMEGTIPAGFKALDTLITTTTTTTSSTTTTTTAPQADDGLYLEPDSSPFTSGAMTTGESDIVDEVNCTEARSAYWYGQYSYGIDLGVTPEKIRGLDVYNIHAGGDLSTWYNSSYDSLKVFKSSDNSTWTEVDSGWDAPEIFYHVSNCLGFRLDFSVPVTERYFKVVNTEIAANTFAFGAGGASGKVSEIVPHWNSQTTSTTTTTTSSTTTTTTQPSAEGYGEDETS